MSKTPFRLNDQLLAYVGINPEVGGSSPFQLTGAHHRTQILSPVGAITVKLPTTGILVGDTWTFTNTTTNIITIQASDATAIASLGQGSVSLMPTLNTPTNTAHWQTITITANDVPNLDMAKITTGNLAGSRVAAATGSAAGTVTRELASTAYTPIFGGFGVGPTCNITYSTVGQFVVMCGVITVGSGTISGIGYIQIPINAQTWTTYGVPVGVWRRTNNSTANSNKGGLLVASANNAGVLYLSFDAYALSYAPGSPTDTNNMFGAGEVISIYAMYMKV